MGFLGRPNRGQGAGLRRSSDGKVKADVYDPILSGMLPNQVRFPFRVSRLDGPCRGEGVSHPLPVGRNPASC